MKTILTLAMTGCLAIALVAAQSRSAADQYQEALRLEEVKGDLEGAIELYKKIAQGADRSIAAKALVQLAGCYEKLGQSDARALYERVVSDFKDQPESVVRARTGLAALQSAAAAPSGQVLRQIWNDVDESDSGPFGVSADGRYLSFTDGNSSDLVVRDLRVGTNRHLTGTKFPESGGYAMDSLVSPDGGFVAYKWEINTGELGGSFEVRILPVTGPGEPRVVHRSKINTWPEGWSPDGKNLLVGRRLPDGAQRITPQIAVISIADGSIRTIKSLNPRGSLKMSWSPDGQWIAYDHSEEFHASARDIFLVAADGSRETPVVQSPGEDRWPVWSPDGSQILFVSDRSGSTALWRLHVDAGKAVGEPELVKLQADIGYPLGITKSGALHYVLRDQTSRVYSVGVDANMRAMAAPVLATDRFADSNVYPAVSPDGQFLAFVSVRGMLPDSPDSVIVIRSVTTGEERDLRSISPSIRGRESLRWFPDSRSLLVRSQPDKRTGRIGFYRVFTSGEKAQLLVERENEGGVSDVSPDGKSVYYVNRSQAPGKLMRFDLDSRREVEISTAPVSPNDIQSVAVSPDGAQLALSASRWVGLMPVSGGEPRPLAGPVSEFFAWTPDQRYLLVVKDGELCRIPAAGGEAEKIGIKGEIRFPELDPSGQRLTYQANEESASTLWVLENFLPKIAAEAIKAGGSK